MQAATEKWTRNIIREEEFQSYLTDGQDFIDDRRIDDLLGQNQHPDPRRIRDIIQKSLSLSRLEPDETAALLHVQDDDLWEEIFQAGAEVKNRVYGPRVVTFAPFYLSNYCTNSCIYCGFRQENKAAIRRKLTLDEVRQETRALVSSGHKRLIVVYGEHPESDIDYICDTVRVIYDTKVGHGEIRRVNINAAPLCIEDYKRIKEVGIGTYQVFQETYHHETYRKVHPRGVKSHYQWRLYAQHRAQEAGIDDVAIGALFGLYHWRFEVMGLLHHAIALEKAFGGVGPHTISFPRVEPAADTPFANNPPHRVDDRDFKRLVAVIRLSVPYTGMIITAREPADVRRDVMKVGCTQTDASSRIGIGAYAEAYEQQASERQQFLLGDPRSLDEVIRELAEQGQITSFCTAGYRCGRTGSYFMSISKQGKTHLFCIPNAILTFKEYLIDYASPETRAIGERLIQQRLNDVPENMRAAVEARLQEIEHGARDLFF